MDNSLKVENEILERVRQKTGRNSDKELAELLGLKQGNFSARKQRGSLLPVVVEWAINTDIDLNWLLRGEAERNDVQPTFLQKIEIWLAELTREDGRADSWFEYEFERAFREFKKWRMESVRKQDNMELRKQAGGGGWE